MTKRFVVTILFFKWSDVECKKVRRYTILSRRCVRSSNQAAGLAQPPNALFQALGQGCRRRRRERWQNIKGERERQMVNIRKYYEKDGQMLSMSIFLDLHPLISRSLSSWAQHLIILHTSGKSLTNCFTSFLAFLAGAAQLVYLRIPGAASVALTFVGEIKWSQAPSLGSKAFRLSNTSLSLTFLPISGLTPFFAFLAAPSSNLVSQADASFALTSIRW